MERYCEFPIEKSSSLRSSLTSPHVSIDQQELMQKELNQKFINIIRQF